MRYLLKRIRVNRHLGVLPMLHHFEFAARQLPAGTQCRLPTSALWPAGSHVNCMVERDKTQSMIHNGMT